MSESCHTYKEITSPASGSWQTALKKLANPTAPAPPTLAEILKSQLDTKLTIHTDPRADF